jgi:hypothetical protein
MGEDGQQDGSTIEIDNNILLQSVWIAMVSLFQLWSHLIR